MPQAEGTFTFTLTGTTDRAPFPGLDADEQVRHKGELVYPNLMISLSADHVASFPLVPKAPDRTLVVVDFLFHPDEMAKATFDPSDAVDFWDLVNRQDWAVCQNVQDGMTSRRFGFGWYAPMEDLSLDIRRYLAERVGRGRARRPGRRAARRRGRVARDARTDSTSRSSGSGGIGSGGGVLARRGGPGLRVLGLEQFELGHPYGASRGREPDHPAELPPARLRAPHRPCLRRAGPRWSARPGPRS